MGTVQGKSRKTALKTRVGNLYGESFMMSEKESRSECCILKGFAHLPCEGMVVCSAPTTTQHKLGGLNDGNASSHTSGGWNSKITIGYSSGLSPWPVNCCLLPVSSHACSLLFLQVSPLLLKKIPIVLD